MTQSGFIAVIDFGTSRIKGVVGRRNDNGVISILASGSIDSDNSIRRGMVYNIEQAGANLQKLVMMLENSMGRKIGKVYVSLAGQSLHTLEFNEMLNLSSGMVTEVIVAQLRKAAEKFQPELKRNYSVADVEYYIDDKPERNPVGVTGSQIEAGFELIIGRPNLLSNIEKSIASKTGLEIADYIVGTIASASIVLSDEEKELGCVFLDFGAGTTTLSVYKDGILRRMVVIPFGGRTITKDICALNFTENDAEQLKKKFGKAMEKQEGTVLASPFSSTAKPDIDLAELNKVIVMRLDEITANIREQVSLSGYEGRLGSGVIITGGASQLKNLDLYLAEKLKMPVRNGTARKTFINNSPDLVSDPSFTQALGMLIFGDEDCELNVSVLPETGELEDDETGSSGWFGGKKKKQKNEKKDKKTKQEGRFLSMMEDVFGGIFTEEDDE